LEKYLKCALLFVLQIYSEKFVFINFFIVILKGCENDKKLKTIDGEII